MNINIDGDTVKQLAAAALAGGILGSGGGWTTGSQKVSALESRINSIEIRLNYTVPGFREGAIPASSFGRPVRIDDIEAEAVEELFSDPE